MHVFNSHYVFLHFFFSNIFLPDVKVSYVIEDPGYPASEEILSMARKEYEYTLEYKNRTGDLYLISLFSFMLIYNSNTAYCVSCSYLKPISTRHSSIPCPCILLFPSTYNILYVKVLPPSYPRFQFYDFAVFYYTFSRFSLFTFMV